MPTTGWRRKSCAALAGGGQTIALFNVDGTYYAIAATCCHRGASVAQGAKARSHLPPGLPGSRDTRERPSASLPTCPGEPSGSLLGSPRRGAVILLASQDDPIWFSHRAKSPSGHFLQPSLPYPLKQLGQPLRPPNQVRVGVRLGGPLKKVPRPLHQLCVRHGRDCIGVSPHLLLQNLQAASQPHESQPPGRPSILRCLTATAMFRFLFPGIPILSRVSC